MTSGHDNCCLQFAQDPWWKRFPNPKSFWAWWRHVVRDESGEEFQTLTLSYICHNHIELDGSEHVSRGGPPTFVNELQR